MDAVLNKLIQHPRCAILPSPEKLDTCSTSPGKDESNTRGDFDKVWQWLTSSRFLNIGFYKNLARTVNRGRQLQDDVFKTFIKLAFGLAFDPIRNTYHPEHDELVLLYYTGHGLKPQHAERLKGRHRPSPRLDKVGFSDPKKRFQAAEPFLTPNRTLKGGELCLHDVGFCDLEGLLTPWIAAVKNQGSKKNKHLVVIADSCYSGVLVEDLQKLRSKEGPWKQNECTVTVQSACQSKEPTIGDYFTPCFVYFNQPENQRLLQVLKRKWERGRPEVKNSYRTINLPSPQVATTMPVEKLVTAENDPIMVLPTIQGFQLTLFPDARFFKFCFLSLSEIEGAQVRALRRTEAFLFLLQARFMQIDIMDYKLMTISNGTPMAIFLVNQKNHVVCVHIHFSNATNSDYEFVISEVNLIHHNMPTNAGRDGRLFLGDSTIDNRKCSLDNRGTRRLVRQCGRYVNKKEPGKWNDVSLWNMGKFDLGVNWMFMLKERDAWMESYVENFIT